MEKASLQDKAALFLRLEEAVAFERACSSLELLAETMSKHRWAKELHFRWRSAAHMAPPQLTLSASVSADDQDLTRNNLTLSSMVDFTIAAGRLAQGEFREKDLSDLRQFGDAARGAFILGARQCGFDADSALDFKTSLELCEKELSKAFAWAERRRLSWLDKGALESNWAITLSSQSAFSSSKALAEALKMPALAAELERRTLAAEVSAHPEASDSPRGPRSL
jgi:hypothetical protein